MLLLPKGSPKGMDVVCFCRSSANSTSDGSRAANAYSWLRHCFDRSSRLRKSSRRCSGPFFRGAQILQVPMSEVRRPVPSCLVGFSHETRVNLLFVPTKRVPLVYWGRWVYMDLPQKGARLLTIRRTTTLPFAPEGSPVAMNGHLRVEGTQIVTWRSCWTNWNDHRCPIIYQGNPSISPKRTPMVTMPLGGAGCDVIIRGPCAFSGWCACLTCFSPDRWHFVSAFKIDTACPSFRFVGGPEFAARQVVSSALSPGE